MSGAERILAAGGVLWRGEPDAPELAVVHRPRYDDWSLPKGKQSRGEHLLTTAVREVSEETAQRPVVGRDLGLQRYPQPTASGAPGLKVVRYWAMRAGGPARDFVPNDEVDQLVWLAPKPALRRLSYPRDRAPVRRLLSMPLGLATVLLVRHARAGARSRWPGADELRPLDTAGERQAVLLRDALALFGPTAVHSAPPVRCLQTVAPLAERLGLALQEEPALSDDAAAADSHGALERVRAIAAAEGCAGGCAVVCSQGGAIPALVGELARRDRLALHSPKARKGSIWSLFFADGRLCDAAYLPDVEPS